MSKPTNLHDVLIEEGKDLYSAEIQLIKALPKMAKAASDPKLKAGFTAHLAQTRQHADRLEQVAELLGSSARGKTCEAMKGLIKEGGEKIDLPRAAPVTPA